jgi:hypothetical protein
VNVHYRFLETSPIIDSPITKIALNARVSREEVCKKLGRVKERIGSLFIVLHELTGNTSAAAQTA